MQPEKLEKVEVQPARKAPTIDLIYDAIQEKRLVAADNVRAIFEKYTRQYKGFPTEVFNFGTLPHEVILDAQRDALNFIEHGVFKMPYKNCLYRCNVVYPDGVTIGVALLNVEAQGGDDAGVGTIYFAHHRIINGSHPGYDNYVTAVNSINRLLVRRDKQGEGVMLELPKSEHDFWKKTMIGDNGVPPNKHQLCDGSMLAMGLTMILNTKGVHKERFDPPAKPNDMRVKKGRPLLPYVTRVYTAAYARSTTDPTQVTKGTHASPRPHRRRAHVRHYVRDGREWWTPVEAMLVNWDGKPLERGEYVVKGDDQDA